MLEFGVATLNQKFQLKSRFTESGHTALYSQIKLPVKWAWLTPGVGNYKCDGHDDDDDNDGKY